MGDYAYSVGQVLLRKGTYDEEVTVIENNKRTISTLTSSWISQI